MENNINETENTVTERTASVWQRARDLMYKDGVLNKKALIAILLVIAVILIIIIVATVKGDNATPANIAGKYEIEKVESRDDNNLSDDDLRQMQSLGMTITLDVREDGTATMDIFGQSTDITYDTESMTMNVGGDEVPFSYKRGKLQIEQNGSTMIFAK